MQGQVRRDEIPANQRFSDVKAEGEGFEPSVDRKATTVFETPGVLGRIPLWERVCGPSKPGALHNALH